MLVLTHVNTTVIVERVMGNFILHLLKEFIILITARAVTLVNLV